MTGLMMVLPTLPVGATHCDHTETFGPGQQTQSFTVPADVTSINIVAYGAQGGRVDSYPTGGQGGMVEATLAVTPGTGIEILVGNQGGNVTGIGSTGSPGAGGSVGGGEGGRAPTVASGGHAGAGGGGASLVRYADDSALIVVAGGGGGGAHNGFGGGGGYPTGEAGGPGFFGTPAVPGIPGTQVGGGGGGGTQTEGGAGGVAGPTVGGQGVGTAGIAGGALQGGTGGDSTSTQPDSGGGGGGGYYGGGGGGGAHGSVQGSGGGGGGGSSWAHADATDVSYENGVRPGDGLVTITYTDPDCTDLAIEKDASVVSGRTVEFVLTVTNNGPNDDPDVVVTDTFPQGIEYTSDDCDGVFDEGIWTWNVGPLANGASDDCTIVGEASGPGDFTNVAEVTGELRDPITENNEDEDTVVILPLADLGVVKTAAPAITTVGGTVVYTLEVTNHGPDDTTGVFVEDTLPDGVTYVSDTCEGELQQGLWFWEIGDLENGEVVSCEITVTVDEQGIITNTATVGGDDEDPNPDNDEDDADVVVDPEADLEVIKTATPLVVTVGDDVTYTLVARNNGPDNATGVVVTDQLPDQVDYISDTCDGVAGSP